MTMKSDSTVRAILILCSLSCCALITKANTETETFDGSICESYFTKHFNVPDGSEYIVKWNGGKLSDTCKFVFNPVDDDQSLCVETQRYHINNCYASLNYYGGIGATILEHTYGCTSSSPSLFCGVTSGNIGIELSGASLSTSSTFSLRIYRQAHTRPKYAVIIGGVIAGLVFFGIVVAVIVICRRRHASSGSIYRSMPNYPQTINTSVSNTYVPYPAAPNTAAFQGTANAPSAPYPGHTPTVHHTAGYGAPSY